MKTKIILMLLTLGACFNSFAGKQDSITVKGKTYHVGDTITLANPSSVEDGSTVFAAVWYGLSNKCGSVWSGRKLIIEKFKTYYKGKLNEQIWIICKSPVDPISKIRIDVIAAVRLKELE